MQSLWMLFASFVFAIMGVCVKLASSLYSTAEIVMYRGLVGTVFMFAFVKLHRGSFRTAFPWEHVWRGVVGVIALGLWFHAIGELPLPAAMTLNYMSPVWIAAILFAASWWRRRKSGDAHFEWGLTAAIVMSFVGVTMLLRPAFQSDQWLAASVGLLSGFLSALAYLQVRHLGQLGEPEYRVVFYFSVTGLIAGLIGAFVPGLVGAAPTVWHAHTPKGLALLFGVGITATVAQIAMTRAYRYGKTLVTANLQYTGIVFSSFWGVVLWQDALGWLGWAGIAVILVSGMAATVYNARNATTRIEKETDPISAEL
ncbi:MAG TPA: DMT family transporter [Paucimonas sp.]|nr:DMT family transporter [Paucimonas sp.]